MIRLADSAAELVSELALALSAAGRSELAEQLVSAVVERFTYDPTDDLGYVYLVRPPPSFHFSKLSTPVAETITFDDEHGINVDIDHDGRLFGIELINRHDLLNTLVGHDLMRDNIESSQADRALPINQIAKGSMSSGLMQVWKSMALVLIAVVLSFSLPNPLTSGHDIGFPFPTMYLREVLDTSEWAIDTPAENITPKISWEALPFGIVGNLLVISGIAIIVVPRIQRPYK